MIDNKDVQIGNKFIGLINNQIIEIVKISRSSNGLLYVIFQDEKGKQHELSVATFVRLQLKRIK